MVSVSRWTAWLLAGATLVAGLGLVAVLYTGQRGPEPSAPSVPSPSAQVPDPAPDPQPVQQLLPPAPPAFDVVRVAEDGGALVAGSALAGAAVVLRVDGVPVAETSADSAGQFVSIFTLSPSDAVQVMTLEMLLADGRVIRSDDRVVLAPRPEAVTALVDAAPESVALALLPPEPPALPVGADAPSVSAAPTVGQTPGHEAASSVLVQPEPPADDSAGVPVAGRDLPPVLTEAPEEAAIQATAETADEPADQATGEVATEVITGTATEMASPPVAETAAAQTAAEETTAESIPRTAIETASETAVTPDTAPEALQALVRVPGRTPDAVAPASSDEAAPLRFAALPEVQEPGHEAAAAVLAGEGVAVDAGAETSIAVGDMPEPAAEPAADLAADPATPAPRPRATSSVETVADVSEPAPARPPVEAPSAEAIERVAEPAENLVPRAFVLRGSGAVDLLDRAPEVMDNVVIDMISYSDTGDVQISGRAVSRETGARVQIYLDNRPIALALAENGDWSSDLPAVDPGVYALRVDQLDSDGRVVSRFETPFQREDPALVRAARARGAEVSAQAVAAGEAAETAPHGEARDTSTEASTEASTDAPTEAPTDVAAQLSPDSAAEPAAGGIEAAATASADLAQPGAQQSVALMTVQPGHSLWRISEGHYGAGDRYLLIYNANRGQIRNPDLIYPGQIFVLPE